MMKLRDRDEMKLLARAADASVKDLCDYLQGRCKSDSDIRIDARDARALMRVLADNIANEGYHAMTVE